MRSEKVKTVFEITEETTLEAAERLSKTDSPIFCLNFASAKNPGGGFLTGAQAQEESLARSSALYPCIAQMKAMYSDNKHLNTCLYSDDMIYSPNVPVFRKDNGDLLDAYYNVSFLTSPAVNAGVIREREAHNVEKINSAMEMRLEKLLSIAVVKGYKTLLLFDRTIHIPLAVNIIARIVNPTDLFTVFMAKDVLDAHSFEHITLTISYLMAARMDRQMTESEPFSLRIVAAMLNQAGFRRISIFDPHSDVSTALILRSKAIGNESFVNDCLEHFYQNQEYGNYTLISPDARALKKIYKVAQFVDAPSVIECSKIRDVKTGQLSGFNTQIVDFQGKTCFIIDDICDGGGTFIGLAALLKSRNSGKIVLIVSHGIFSKGFDLANIDAIYTTDSFQNFGELPNHVVVLPFRCLDKIN